MENFWGLETDREGCWEETEAGLPCSGVRDAAARELELCLGYDDWSCGISTCADFTVAFPAASVHVTVIV